MSWRGRDLGERSYNWPSDRSKQSDTFTLPTRGSPFNRLCTFMFGRTCGLIVAYFSLLSLHLFWLCWKLKLRQRSPYLAYSNWCSSVVDWACIRAAYTSNGFAALKNLSTSTILRLFNSHYRSSLPTFHLYWWIGFRRTPSSPLKCANYSVPNPQAMMQCVEVQNPLPTHELLDCICRFYSEPSNKSIFGLRPAIIGDGQLRRLGCIHCRGEWWRIDEKRQVLTRRIYRQSKFDISEHNWKNCCCFFWPHMNMYR